MIPTRKECLDLIREYNLPDGLVRHVMLVTKTALFLTNQLRKRGIKINQNLVEAGALLHDIGKIKAGKRIINHGEKGEKILKESGFFEVAPIVRKHEAPAAIKGIFPTTMEEKVVFYADKISRERIITTDERLSIWQKKYPNKGEEIEKIRPRIKEIEKEILEKIGMTFKELKEVLENEKD